ncbi:MAG: hypothetical protein ACHP84_11020 [Caulobacterales bacterium]
MKIRRLPETDLARIAPMARIEKRRALERQSTGFTQLTYDPVRAATLDILNAQSPLLGSTSDTPWSVVERAIRRASRTTNESESNVGVGHLLYDFVREQGMRATQVAFSAFQTRIGDSVRYWSNAVVVHDGSLVIPFADYRRTFRLTDSGKRFAASIMHEAIRRMNPQDLGDAQLGVFQFPQVAGTDDRTITLSIVPDTDLYSAEELAAMIADTYLMWAEVLQARAAEVRRGEGRGTG